MGTYKSKTVVTVDIFWDGDDLEFTVTDHDGDELRLDSGDTSIVIRKDDLGALAAAYPA